MSTYSYLYAVMFACCLVLTLRAAVRRDVERASVYALCSIWLFFALYISTFWNA